MNKWNKKLIKKSIKSNWPVYLFWLPAIVYIVIFQYAPMYGIQIAFRDYRYQSGFFGSEWVGLKWLKQFFNSPRFWLLIKNTLSISIYSLLANFPFPIILALIMNNIRSLKFKKIAQTITYMPHFISVVILVGMMQVLFSPRSGMVNNILDWLGIVGDYYFMGEPQYFIHMYVWSSVWQSMGWGSIIYMAALAGVDPTLYEAARIDGANKLQRAWYIDIPSILPTICIILIMNFGSVMSLGYEKVYLMQNQLNLQVSEVVSTYVYKVGLVNRQFSYSAAIGLFNNVINFILVLTVNKIVKKLSGSGLW